MSMPYPDRHDDKVPDPLGKPPEEGLEPPLHSARPGNDMSSQGHHRQAHN